MEIKVQQGDIAKRKSDVLIYSTNRSLILSGGVGKSLVDEFGFEIQDQLWRKADLGDDDLAEIGSVYECRSANMPSKLVFHCVVIDEMYSTELGILRTVLTKCFDECELAFGVHSIVLSALGCGFGDLLHSEFIKALVSTLREYEDTDINEVIVLCNNPDYYSAMVHELEAIK